jgi:Terminase large subunit, T4likevirus-type, N-terminal
LLTAFQRRIARLESLQPRPEPTVRLLAPRAPTSWVPQGVSQLTAKQSDIFLHPARFRVVVAGRRSGKSYLSVAELIRAARSGHNKLCWYVAPSYRMAKQTLWAALKSAIPSAWIAHKSEIDLSITLKGYGSTICLRSSDNPDSLRGVGLDFAVLDEFSSIDPNTWTEVIRPALADKHGHAVIQGSPRGYNSLYDLYSQASETDGWAGFHFSTLEGGLVAPEEIEAVKDTLDPRTFAQEFEADFAQSVNRVYLMFDRRHNVRSDIVDVGALPRAKWEAEKHGPTDLVVGLDFNVNPLSAVLGNVVGDELHFFDEIELHNANTEQMAEELKRRFPDRRIIAYPDPTGHARKTSAPVGQTDFTILQRAGFKVVAPPVPYAVVDKTNSVNALLLNTQGRRRLFLSPRCKSLIRGFEQLSYKEKTSVIDKNGLDHMTDAAAYVVMGIFPIVTRTLTQEKLIMG